MLGSLIDVDEPDTHVEVEDLQPMSLIEEFDLVEIKLQNKTYFNKMLKLFISLCNKHLF